ncbi:uncharacterized protein N7515_006302 [Penicillium bovifimosum]|uniref:FAD/NAD(P)-binding domain-containing protein n=1 Tax=Penicillium bovifimosum TaxID=126998 RepID=A0A9W9KZL9_9EURO|nr:uncharacterized protein N7515_006302 [Penicillium bovifimosum]KAJ5130263.1 hypothetical protein N7515_006302 [Penicillium bovifimosum]
MANAEAVPSRERVVPGSCNIPLGEFPETMSGSPFNPDILADQTIERLNEGLAIADKEAISVLFLKDSYWRDHLCYSWDFHTREGAQAIATFVTEAPPSKIEIDRSSALKSPHRAAIDGFGDVFGIEFFIKVTTDNGQGDGVIRLAEQNGEWKIFTVFTSLVEVKGHAQKLERPFGVRHGEQQGRKNWKDRRNDEINFVEKEPTVLVVGAGQGGLGAAARLKVLGVDTLVIDREVRVGDNWRNRYHQLVLHDPVWYDHMPYLPFPSDWPIYTPKDKLADFFETYVQFRELNVWTQTEIKSSSWDESKKQWMVVLERQTESGTETRTFHPRHVIQATGHSGKKNLPEFKGMGTFKGDRMCHSAEFPGANPESKGKKAIVVGSCNSAHDIAQDFVEKGYDVTMVQRSSTCVVSSESTLKISFKGLYDGTGPPTEDADLYLTSIPLRLFKAQQVKTTKLICQNDAQTIEGLEKAGFKVDMGSADSGLLFKYYQRGGGYYIDVGGSQLIIDGKIKVKQGQEISEVLPHGLRFADGSELEADEIVFATGYQNMRTETRVIFGDEVADRVGDVWGLDNEGEMRTIWRRSGHPGFWFMGGNLALSRYYSRLLALQIKALETGLTTW